MKKILFLIVSIFAVSYLVSIVGCSNDRNEEIEIELTENEMSLILMSPNDIKIAKDVYELKSMTSRLICESNGGIQVRFEITKIEYVDVSKGCAALIEYKTADGIISNYLLVSPEVQIEYETPASVKYISNPLKTRVEVDDSWESMQCTGSCTTSPFYCALHITYYTDGSKPTVKCTCNSCTLEIKFRD